VAANVEGGGGRRYRPQMGHRGFARGAAPVTARPPRNPPRDTVVPATGAAPVPRGEVVLEVRDLRTYFFTYDGVVRALDGVNLLARRGETTGLVGETGCGKSVTAFSITRLISDPGRVISGEVFYRSSDLLWGLEREAKFRKARDGRIRVRLNFRRVRAANERLAAVRGRRIAMIFQEPSQAMNPVFTISDQLGEAILLHKGPEVIDQLLEADRAWRAAHGALSPQVDYAGGASDAVVPSDGSAIRAEIDKLVASPSTDDAGMRAECGRLADAVNLRSTATEAYYVIRNFGMGDPQRGRRLRRALRRVALSSWQRGYLRHERRLMVLKAQADEISLAEMQMRRSFRFERRVVQARRIRERLRGLPFHLPYVFRRVSKPLKLETFWRVVLELERVRIANPVQVSRGFPHELSGGMLQRVMIAMALSGDPDVLIADEPTTALDVTIQAQILDLMRDLRERVGTAIVLITHDLGVIAEVCDRVNVMYAGLVVESAPAKELFRRPLHPYAQGLLSSIPRFDQPDRELQTIPGSVPNLITPPPGCRFHPRCPYAMPICKEVRPEPTLMGPDHTVSCHLYTVPPEGAQTAEAASATTVASSEEPLPISP
jgi:peptide/nickel transport system ATP-binding protein